MACYVYFIGTSAGVKIGRSCSPINRMADMQVGCPVTMKMLGSEYYPDRKAAQVREDELHEQFRGSLIHGEWFDTSEKLAQVIGITLGETKPHSAGRFVRDCRAEYEATIRDIRFKTEHYREMAFRFRALLDKAYEDREKQLL